MEVLCIVLTFYGYNSKEINTHVYDWLAELSIIAGSVLWYNFSLKKSKFSEVPLIFVKSYVS